jgi:hypothetical protein
MDSQDGYEEMSKRSGSTELGMGARHDAKWWSGESTVRYKFYEGTTEGHVSIKGAKWQYRLHNHPGNTAPSLGDYVTARTNWNNGILSTYGLYSNGSFYGYQSYQAGSYSYWKMY